MSNDLSIVSKNFHGKKNRLSYIFNSSSLGTAYNKMASSGAINFCNILFLLAQHRETVKTDTQGQKERCSATSDACWVNHQATQSVCTVSKVTRQKQVGLSPHKVATTRIQECIPQMYNSCTNVFFANFLYHTVSLRVRYDYIVNYILSPILTIILCKICRSIISNSPIFFSVFHVGVSSPAHQNLRGVTVLTILGGDQQENCPLLPRNHRVYMSPQITQPFRVSQEVTILSLLLQPLLLLLLLLGTAQSVQ